jgi:hypothetical protein
MVQQSMEDTSHFQDEESNGRRAKETPPDLVAMVRSLKSNSDEIPDQEGRVKHCDTIESI